MAGRLPKGIRKKGVGFEARASVKGKSVCLYNKDLDQLIKEFEEEKLRIIRNADMATYEFTLDEWFTKWFDDVKAHKVKETSISPMKNNYKRTFGFYIGNMKLKSIKPMDVQNAVNAMEKSGMSSSSMRESLGRLRECMEFAVGNQLISVNPCLIVEVPWTFKVTKEEIALTQEEQNIFLNEVEDSWYKEMFYFMFLTGVRVGELGGLRWSDIDFVRKEIHINNALSCNYYKGEKREMLVAPKTISSVRTIPFIGEMEDILNSQLQKQKKLRKDLGKRFRSTGELKDIVFCSSMGGTCSRYIVEKEIKKVLKRMNEQEAVRAVEENRLPRVLVRDFHPHTIRHTFATRCFENQMEPKVVQKLMGHSTISITLNIYTHVLDQKMGDEIRKFGSANTNVASAVELAGMELQGITAKSHT